MGSRAAATKRAVDAELSMCTLVYERCGVRVAPQSG
jgi:hypothetical protein